jgi:hypothetical protein
MFYSLTMRRNKKTFSFPGKILKEHLPAMPVSPFMSLCCLGSFSLSSRRKTQMKRLLYMLLVGNLDGGNANNYGTNTNFWSGSAGSATVAWRRNLNNSNSGANRNTNNKYNSFSVRCKK